MPAIPERQITQEMYDKLKEMSAEHTEDGQPMPDGDLLIWFWRLNRDRWKQRYKTFCGQKMVRGETITYTPLEI